MISWLLPFVASPASACGGLFCNNAAPVVQEAERIVFGVEEPGQIEMHVQVFYQGEAEDFAWIVPVPAEPTVFLSNQDLFDRLSTTTGPVYRLNPTTEGVCKAEPQFFAQDLALFAGVGDAGTPVQPGVQVLSEEQVGPYETEVLATSSEAALTEYLSKRGYDIPAGLSEALAPYVDAGTTHFLALRLESGADVGDISPLGLSYPGTEPAIPIRLTRVAVAENLPLEVYVFARERAVPLSYLHVRINEAAIDWFRGGANYPDVVAVAADEAGGRAFVTDYYGPSQPFSWTYAFRRERLAAAASFAEWVEETKRQQVPGNAQTLAVLADVTDITHVDPQELYDCPRCYEGGDFDPAAATELLDRRVLEPLERIEDLFGLPVLTRMTSTLSASEMTVDPVFGVVDRPDDPLEQTRTAELVTECHARRDAFRAPRRLDLADGRQLDLPSRAWMNERSASDFDLLTSQLGVRAQVIEQYDRDGRSEILFDHTDELFELAETHNRTVRELVGCAQGCSTQGALAGGWSWLGGLALLVGLRRRDGRACG